MDSEQVVQVVLRMPAESRWRINRIAKLVGVSVQKLLYKSVMATVERGERKHAMSDADRKNDDPSQYEISEQSREERKACHQERRDEDSVNGDVTRKKYGLLTDRPAEATATDLQQAKAK